jgi:hypothetical protein
MHALDHLLDLLFTGLTSFTDLSGHAQPSMPSYRHLGCMCWSRDHLMADVGGQHLPNKIWNAISLVQIR